IESLKAKLLIKEAKVTKAVCLREEAQTLKECNTYLEKEKSELEIKVTDLATSVKVKEQEVADLDAVVTSMHKLEAASFGLPEKLSHYENLTERLEEFQDAQLKIFNDKLEKLYADFVDMVLHLKEKFYPHLLTTISGCRWLLAHGMELAITKCLHSSDYLSALGAAIGKAIEKAMQLRSNKDANVDTIMNILRLEDNLAKRLGLTESQPYVDQLMVPIHHSPDRVLIGATSMSSALDVLTGTGGTSNTVHAPITMALSVTSIFVSTIPPISTDGYEIAHTKAVADEGANPFPDVSGAKLDVLE
nr:hypothetical protein [Tanacetum cinerariifolium]